LYFDKIYKLRILIIHKVCKRGRTC